VVGPRLRLSGIQKRFGATQALAGVDLAVAPGEVHALVGENGAGKSTLMKVLSGVHAPDAGTLELDGRPFAPRHPLDARRAGVAMVNQELALAPHLTVAENLVLGAEPARGPFLRHADGRRLAAAALAGLGRPDLPLDLPAGRLGVGEQQLVEIRRLRDQGHAVVYISHFLEEVEALADRYTVLRDGRSVATGRVADVTKDDLARLMVGRNVDELYHRSARTPGEVVLSCDALAGRRRPVHASLDLRRGEVLGLAGIIGAGRSELLRVLFGLDPVRSGTLRVGTFAGPASPLRRWSQGLGLLGEDRKDEGLALDLDIEANLTLPRLDRWLRPAALAEETRGWIGRLDVRCTGPDQPVRELSGGNQQKVALGRLLRNGADILLLDEPTRGVDIGAKQQIYRLIDRLAGEGCAVLMVSSYLPELLGTCDRIAVMCRGELGPARPVADWDEHAIMRAATGSPSP
jgi:ribose transport system ATP-binding protein